MSDVPAQEDRLARQAARRKKRRARLKKWRAGFKKWGVFYAVGFAVIVATAYGAMTIVSQPPRTGIGAD